MRTVDRELLECLPFLGSIIRETPIVHLSNDTISLYAKLEYLNGVGSIKDRPALYILKRAIQRGEIGKDTSVVESSSGNFACSLATFCKILRVNFVPVIDPNISPVYEAYLRAQCKTVIKVEESDDAGGFLKARLRRVKALLAEISDSYWPNQYGNPDGALAHYELTAGEIIHALPDVAYVFVAVSSAGTIAGISTRLKERNPKIKIIAVDAEGSVIFGQTPKKRYLPGIGSSISPPLIQQAQIDDVVIVPEQSAIWGCHELLRVHGLFVGASTGSAYFAVRKYFDGRQKQGGKVLFLCCDRGTAYLHNVFDANWLTARWGSPGLRACLGKGQPISDLTISIFDCERPYDTPPHS